MNEKIKGVIVPMLTPFDQRGHIDNAAIKRLVDFLIDRGVKGLFPGGTTGEGPLLSVPERCQLAEAVVGAANGRVPVIVHTGSITSAETVELTKHAQAIGADAAALISPYYFHHCEEALFQHFKSVVNQVPEFSIYLYNNPGVGNNRLSEELVCRLIEQCPNIVGVKDSNNSLEMLTRLSSLYNGRLNTASGNDGQILSSIAMGLDACVSGNANVVPELIVALYHATTVGNLALARELQRHVNNLRQLLKDGSDLSLLKGVLARRGLSVGAVRAPLLQAPEAIIAQRWQALSALGIELSSI